MQILSHYITQCKVFRKQIHHFVDVVQYIEEVRPLTPAAKRLHAIVIFLVTIFTHYKHLFGLY